MTRRRENIKQRMRRLVSAAIAEAMANHPACETMTSARGVASEAIIELVWDWFEIRERKRRA